MYDENNPTHVAELKDEVLTDPLARGYDPNGNDDVLVALLNVPDFTVSKPAISTAAVRSATFFDAFDGLVTVEQAWFTWLTGGGGRLTDDDLTVTPDLRLRLAGDGGTSVWAISERPAMEAAILALMDVPGGRGEVLWGYGTRITVRQWIAARDSV